MIGRVALLVTFKKAKPKSQSLSRSHIRDLYTIQFQNMKKSILVVTLTILSFSSIAQHKYLTGIQETRSLSEKIARLFEQNEISDAFDVLRPYWPIPENEVDQLEEKTIKYLNLINQRFGESIGTVKVKNEAISDIALRETYLIRYERTAIRIIVTYYKSQNGWIVNAFKWDDSFAEEFQ